MIWQKKFTKRFVDAANRRLPWMGAMALTACLSACGLLPSSKETQPSHSPAKPAPPTSAAPGKGPAKAVALPEPIKQRSWDGVREQAAHRMVAANPHITYTGAPPEVLLAIPVLSIELNADGSIRRIEVMRQPSQARDTVQTAIQAVRRAAPFGHVSHLPKPWRFSETFLFNDDRHFKPMKLDRR